MIVIALKLQKFHHWRMESQTKYWYLDSFQSSQSLVAGYVIDAMGNVHAFAHHKEEGKS